MRTNRLPYLRHLGLLNEEAPYIGDLMCPTKKVRTAWCSSNRCVRERDEWLKSVGEKIPTHIKVVKDVGQTRTTCPDCHNALIWAVKEVSSL